MLKITFKDVGHGDSIIIEWQKDAINKIGIIDCNSNNGNPTLDYISKSGFSVIDFIILSHPHYDHFSGLTSLLEHCESKRIIIKKFLHTSAQVPQYLRLATRTAKASNELALLFKKINDLWKKKIIEYQTYISDDCADIKLTDELNLKFLSPSVTEFEAFLKNNPIFQEEDGDNKNESNWLSTIIKIYTSEWYVLLTSDVTKQALKRVGIQKKKEFLTMLKLGQSPHHGSAANHYEAFWKTKKYEKDTPIVFSVGKNIYRHPSEETVSFFSDKKNNFKIHSTNKIGALDFFGDSLEVDKIGSFLDLAGCEEILAPNKSNQLQGDQTFTF